MFMSQVTPENSNDNRRSVKNMLVNPGFQLKYGMYFMGFGLVVFLAIFTFVFFTMAQMITSLGSISDIGAEMQDMLNKALISAGMVLGLLILAFALVAVAMGVVLTHRIVGPMIPIRRHIQALVRGTYDSRCHLRDKDELQEIAGDLNDLAMELEKKYGGIKGSGS